MERGRHCTTGSWPGATAPSFVLRIEDTDRERSTPENVEQIFEALRWLGLDWDGDPVFQSERRDRHAEVVEQLIAGGHAYRSTAGPEQVKAFKEAHGNAGFRGEDEGEGAVRLRMPDEGATVVRDVIRGESAFENRLMDDLVIARADGTPVYHLAVVVDDLDAGITHVVRGADHYSNTPKQMRILEAMGAEVPLYAHVPLLHGPDGKKLSKRHGAASVQELRDAGYLPEAVRNYLALLGWGFDEETTFHSDRGAPAALLARARLQEPGRVRREEAALDERPLRARAARRGAHPPPGDLHGPLRAGRGGGDLAREVPDAVGVLAARRASSSTARPTTRSCARSGSAPEETRALLAQAREALAAIEGPWTVEDVEAALSGVVEREGVKPGKLFQPLRVALAGTTVSPGIFETVAVLGRDETLARLNGGMPGLNRPSTDADRG